MAVYIMVMGTAAVVTTVAIGLEAISDTILL